MSGVEKTDYSLLRLSFFQFTFNSLHIMWLTNIREANIIMVHYFSLWGGYFMQNFDYCIDLDQSIGGSRNRSQRSTFRNFYRDINYEHNTILVKKTFRLHLRTFSYSNQHFSVKNCSFHKIKLQEKLTVLSQNLFSIKQLFLLETNGFLFEKHFSIEKETEQLNKLISVSDSPTAISFF